MRFLYNQKRLHDEYEVTLEGLEQVTQVWEDVAPSRNLYLGKYYGNQMLYKYISVSK